MLMFNYLFKAIINVLSITIGDDNISTGFLYKTFSGFNYPQHDFLICISLWDNSTGVNMCEQNFM